jgi:hypothetical protein
MTTIAAGDAVHERSPTRATLSRLKEVQLQRELHHSPIHGWGKHNRGVATGPPRADRFAKRQ